MTEREDNVYKAKLAEQAERYDGKLLNPVGSGSDGPLLSFLNDAFQKWWPP